MKNIYVLLFLTVFVLQKDTYAEDTLQIIAHEKTQMVWHRNYDQKVFFPTEGSQYRKNLYVFYFRLC